MQITGPVRGPVGEDLDDGTPRWAALPVDKVRGEGLKAILERLAGRRPAWGIAAEFAGPCGHYSFLHSELAEPDPLLLVQLVPIPPLRVSWCRGRRLSSRSGDPWAGRAGCAGVPSMIKIREPVWCGPGDEKDPTRLWRPRDIASHFGDITMETMYRQLSRWAETGLIHKIGPGLYAATAWTPTPLA